MANIIAYIQANWVAWLFAPAAGAVGVILTQMAKTIKAQSTESKMLKDAVQTVMVHEMFAIYNDAQARGGWLTIIERQEADRLIKVYHALRWNHTGDFYYDKIKEMPVHDGTEKTPATTQKT